MRSVGIPIIVSRISSAICPSNVKCRHNTYCRLNRRLITLRRPIAKWLCLLSSVFFLIVYIVWDNKFHLHTNPTDTPEVDRETCCHLSHRTEDICGRPNCTLPACTEPKFENDPTNSHFSLDRDKAFFIESSGNGALSYRQACAVESLALHNPNLTVNVLFTDADINAGRDNIPQKLVENYANIQLISINVDQYMAGTVLEHWYQCTNWRSGSYHINNLSNALRLLTVYKFGGYYFDLDIISMRPVTSYRNFLAAESDKDVNNGVIHADLKHPFIELAITDFVANFRPDVWGNNGPALMFRVLKKWCNANILKSMDHVSCRGYNILPTRSFHPVDFETWKELFTQPMVTEMEVNKPISWLTEEVVGVHVWNRMSQNELVYKNSSQVYTQLARQHCPVIFSIAPEIF